MLEFDKERHEYRADGKVIPSVTQILKFLSVDTATNANPMLRDAAARRGSRIHEATEQYEKYGEIDEDLIDAETAPYIEAYIDWVRETGAETLFAEKMMTDGEVAGTADRIVNVNGETAIVDIKTGSSVDVRQVSAQCYKYAALATHYGIKATKLYVLQLKKDGKYSFRELDWIRGSTFFEVCYTLYRMIEEDKKKNKR